MKYKILNFLIEIDNIFHGYLNDKIMKIRENCLHTKLPKRDIWNEQFMDTCPDCRYLHYCY